MNFLEQLLRTGQPAPAAPANMVAPQVSPVDMGGIPLPKPDPAMPRGADAPVPRAKPPEQEGAVAVAPASYGPGSMPERMGGAGNFLGDAFSGVANVRPGMDPLTAFAMGFSGSRQSRKDREDEELALQYASEKLAYDRDMDAKKLALDERGVNIREQAAKFDNLNTAALIRKREAETVKLAREAETEASRYGLTVDQYVREFNRIRDQVRKEYEPLIDNDFSLDREKVEEISNAIDEAARIRFEETLRRGYGATGVQPPSSGQWTAVHPQTGERMIYKDGKWEPMG